MSNTYTCSTCKNTYEKSWSDEEALAETKSEFGDFDKSECDVVCDDCYNEFMKWWKK